MQPLFHNRGGNSRYRGHNMVANRHPIEGARSRRRRGYAIIFILATIAFAFGAYLT